MMRAEEGRIGGNSNAAGVGNDEEDPLLLKNGSPDDANETPRTSFAEKVAVFMENPASSTAATAISWFVVACIFASTVCFIVETIPSVERMQKAVLWFYMLECVFVIVFTLEYVVRLYGIVGSGRRTLWQFVSAPMNVIDVLAVLPWYIDLLFLFVLSGENEVDLRALRAMRLIRMFKLSRMAPQLKTIGSAMERSMASLVFLLVMVSFALITFSTLIFMVERGTWDEKQGCYARNIPEHDCSPYDSIPGSSWWVLTTMTTVGYGDVFPKTNYGRLVGAACMLTGILAVAMPTTVLSIQFSEAYEEINEEDKQKALKKATEADVDKHATRQEAFREGLADIKNAEAKLAVVLQGVQAHLMKITANKPRTQKSVQASALPLMAAALEAQASSRRFLEVYQE